MYAIKNRQKCIWYAHDLQVPLNTIAGFSNLLITQYDSIIDEQGKEFLNFLVTASSRMKEQVEGLLKYSKIGRSSEICNVDLNKLISEILSDFEYDIKNRNAVIHVGALPIIRGYYAENRMLWQNLLSNAMKFQKKGTPPQVNIDWKEDAEFWYFSVEDNGIGIPEKDIDKIFDIFTRLHTQSEYEGSGLGLANCKKNNKFTSRRD